MKLITTAFVFAKAEFLMGMEDVLVLALLQDNRAQKIVGLLPVPLVKQVSPADV